MRDEIDTDLVRRFQGGDMAAFEEFVRRNQQRLQRLAAAFLNEKSGADDAVQEVFIRAYKGLPRFQFRSRPFSWLYKTLKNVCYEINRKQMRTINEIEQESPLADESIQLEQKQEIEKIFSLLPSLSRRERDVVLLRVFEEFNEKETAAILGVKKGTVKSLLHRGISKLQSRYGSILEE